MDGQKLDSTEREYESDGSLSMFEIALDPFGKDSGFHMQNDPKNPYQRENVTERKGAVDIRCSCVDIIHGMFSSDNELFSTLLVLQLRFDPRKRARRIAQVDIELRFSGGASTDIDPVVHAISPNGHLSFDETSQTETTTVGSDMHVGGGVVGIETGGAVKYEKGITRDVNSATRVTGSIDTYGRNYGQPNCASWTLIENPQTKAGVPVAMKVAVLLKRTDERIFKCIVSIEVKADWRTSIEKLVGRSKPDDPILFDPTLDPTSDRYSDAQLCLRRINLDSIADITSAIVVDGATKTQKFGVDSINSGKAG